MDKFISSLIRNVTGKTFTYETYVFFKNQKTGKREITFVFATFDGKKYKTVSFCEDGIIRFEETKENILLNIKCLQ